MIQIIANTKPYNYRSISKMINHLLTNRKLVKVQRDELLRIDSLSRNPNPHESKYVKRLMCETECVQ